MTHDFKRFPELGNSQMQMYYWESPHKQILNSFNAKVVKVTDGDTIRVMWEERDFSFPVRFLDTDAPELDVEGGEESRKWLEDLIMGEEVFIEVDRTNRVEKWGRLLGTIFHEGMNINELSMLENKSVPFIK